MVRPTNRVVWSEILVPVRLGRWPDSRIHPPRDRSRLTAWNSASCRAILRTSCGTDGLASQHGREHPALGQTAHPDGRLDGASRATEEVAAISLHDVDDAEVDVRAKPAIEPDLVLAVGQAPLAGREVEEAEVDRLLDLVGERAGQDDPGDVGLAQLDGVGRVPICLRA